MYKWIIILIAISVPLLANAQSTEDVVYLKNGSVLRGKIVENIPDSIVKIMVSGGNIWSLPMKDISNVSKEKLFNNYKRFLNKEKGYNLITNLGVFFPVSGNKSSYVHFSLISAYSIWPEFSVGLGFSIDRDTRTYCPVYIDARYYLNLNHIAPFFSVSCGKAFAWDKETDFEYRKLRNYGDLYFSTGLGIEFPQNENISILLGVEYKYQRSILKNIPGGAYYELMEENNRIAVKFGFLFN